MSKKSGAARAMPANDPRSIVDYHAHVYYDPATSRSRAERLRERVGAEFPQAKLGAGTMNWSGRIRNRCIRLHFRPRCWRHSCRG